VPILIGIELNLIKLPAIAQPGIFNGGVGVCGDLRVSAPSRQRVGGKAPSRRRQGGLEAALGDFCNFSVKTTRFYA